MKIVKQPKSQLVSVGETVTLRCKATGYPAPQYQWVKDGAELPDGIDKELTLDPVTLYDSENYFCLVSNHVYEKIGMQWIFTFLTACLILSLLLQM